MKNDNNFKNKINSWNEKRKIKNDQQFYEGMLRDKDSGTSSVFNETTLAWMIVIVTVFLQLISLATTYKGSIVYFGGVELPFGLSAPLLFALAVQLIVFCMSHTIRKNFKKGLLLVLIMATLCSTYFSYIGIYNYINSPINYLEERYKQIHGNITDQYDTVREDSKGNIKNLLFNLISKVNEGYTSLTMQIEKNDQLAEDINNIKIDTGKINAQTSSLTRPNINNYGNNLDQYYADMAKYNAAVGNMVTDATKQDSDLKNELYNNEVNSILGGRTQEEFLEESIKTKTTKEQIEKGINTAYGLLSTEDVPFADKLNKIQEYCQDYIVTSQGDRDLFSTLLSSLYAQIQVLDKTEGFENFQNQLNSFLTLNQKDNILMNSLEDIKIKVFIESNNLSSAPENFILTQGDGLLLYSTMQAEIKSAVYTLNQLRTSEEQISLNDEEYIMHNLYVLPINNLIQAGEGRAMAWFCLLFAMLVDGLTLLFAIMQGLDKTPLFAKSNKEIVGNSKEAMEELLLISLLSGDSKSKDEKRVENTLLRLEKFLKPFKINTATMENGYSMCCELSNVEDYQVFLATLCQFNLAKIVSSKDLLLGDESPTDYVLLKSKFVIWANDKIVALTLNVQYIESLQDAGDDYMTKGAIL